MESDVRALRQQFEVPPEGSRLTLLDGLFLAAPVLISRRRPSDDLFHFHGFEVALQEGP
jgi:hypothetical protein